MPESATPAYITSLIRHFEDLRDSVCRRRRTRPSQSTRRMGHPQEQLREAVGTRDLQ
jgi:hypothetical protein